jgi:hypothetical protein
MRGEINKVIDVNEEFIKDYRKEVNRKLMKNTSGFSEDVDKTQALKGELKAINKILRFYTSTYRG